MFDKAECSVCGDRVRHDARRWAHDHVSATGHAVQLTLGYDVRDEHWLENVSPERRAQLDAVREPGVAQAIAQSILTGSKH